MKKILAVLVVSLLALGLIQDVSAAGAHSLSVAPSITDVSLDPGTTVTKRVTIANQGEKGFTLKLSVKPYSIINDQYEASFEPVKGRTLVSDWVSYNNPEVNEVKSGKYVDVDLSISVPAGTPAGGYSAVLLAESSISQGVSTGIVAKNRIGHIMYINVKGDVERKGQVLASQLPLFSFGGDQVVTFTTSNFGGTNEKAKVDVYVQDMFGRRISGQLVERYVLPGTKRHIDTSWTPQGIFGVYNVTSSHTFAGQSSTDLSQWIVIVHPIFLVAAVIAILASVWLRFGRLVTIKRKKS